MWTCPSCGKAFKNMGQPHSCGDYTEEKFLEGKTGEERQLYEGFKDIIRGFGPTRVSPAKTRIGFIATVTFAAVNRVGGGKVCGHIILRSKRDSPKFTKIEGPISGWYVHNFCFDDLSFFDDEMMAYVRESYVLGSMR